jgi:ankyrin repeat protein
MLRTHLGICKKILVLIAFVLASTGLKAGSFDDFFSAAQTDNESAMVNLAFRGFDLNTRDSTGASGLLVALRQGSLKVADFLLQQNAVDVEARNQAGESPLMMAALKGHLPQARRLIDRRAEVNKPGWTPLHYAASHPGVISADMVRLLLAHFAYIDAESPNQTTPLMMASRYGTDAAVKLLLEEGADPLLRNQQGLSAIDFARAAGRIAAVELIAAQVRAKQPAGKW